METLEDKPSRWAGLGIGVIYLVGIAVGLGILLSLMMHGPDLTDNPAQKLVQKMLARMAWICVAMLGLTLLMLFWLVAHALTQRLRGPRHAPTEYVDAWRLAGERAKPEEEDEEPRQ